MREYIIRNNTPSTSWEDSYPVGNGRMGATIMGYVDEEVLYLNEETVWSSQGKGIPNPNMSDKLKEIRQLFIDGREAVVFAGDSLLFAAVHQSLVRCFSGGNQNFSKNLPICETAGIHVLMTAVPDGTEQGMIDIQILGALGGKIFAALPFGDESFVQIEHNGFDHLYTSTI